MWSIVRLAVLRLPDLLPPFVPFATFLGVVWSESAFTESRERLLIWNSGRSPLVLPDAGAVCGAGDGRRPVCAGRWLRPAAIHVQMDERLGREGIRLDRSQSGGSTGSPCRTGCCAAEIEYGPPLRLHDATIYKLDTRRPSGGSRHRLGGRSPRAMACWLPDKTAITGAPASPTAAMCFTTGAREENEIPFATRTIAMAWTNCGCAIWACRRNICRLCDLHGSGRMPRSCRAI